MSIRVTVWNEFRQEHTDAPVTAIYPDGIHAAIAEGLRESRRSRGPDGHAGRARARPDRGGPGRDGRADLVGPRRPRRGVGRGRRSRPAPGAGGDGPHRPPLRALLADLQAPDGHAAATSSGARTAAANGCGSWIRPIPSPQGLGETFVLPEEEMYGEHFDIPAPDGLVFISWFEGGEVFRSGCCVPPRPRAGSSTSARATRPTRPTTTRTSAASSPTPSAGPRRRRARSRRSAIARSRPRR